MRFQGFSHLIYWKNSHFVFLTPFSLHFFLPFWTFYGILKPIFQSKYGLSTLLGLHLKVINHLSEISGLQWPHILKKYWFFVFEPIFAPFLDLFGALWDPKAPISEQIWIIYIAWPRSQGYKPFKWGSRTSIVSYLIKPSDFVIFHDFSWFFVIFHQNLGFLALRCLLMQV